MGLDSYYEGEKVGRLEIYYSEAIILERLNRNKETANQEVSAFQKITDSRLNKAVISQIFLVMLIIISLIGTIVFCLRAVAIHPIVRVSEKMKTTINKVASASYQVFAESHSLAQRSSEQGNSVENTSTLLKEMTSITRENAKYSDCANRLMEEVNEFVRKADDSMKILIVCMEDISEAAEEIQRIVKTVDEFAFQTNILALNAAIEAARSGEAVLGFAVVAQEVKGLAARSAQASKNTAKLIGCTVRKVNEGSETVKKTKSDFTQILNSASQVGKLISDIASANNGQTQKIEYASRVMLRMNHVAQQNIAGAKETALVSQKLKEQL